MRSALTVKELYELKPEKIVSGREAVRDTELILDHLVDESSFKRW